MCYANLGVYQSIILMFTSYQRKICPKNPKNLYGIPLSKLHSKYSVKKYKNLSSFRVATLQS